MSADGILTCDAAPDRHLTLTPKHKVIMAAEDLAPPQHWRLIRWVNPNVSLDSEDEEEEEEEEQAETDTPLRPRFMANGWPRTGGYECDDEPMEEEPVPVSGGDREGGEEDPDAEEGFNEEEREEMRLMVYGSMFTGCALNVHSMFSECSLNVHSMFTECSPNVQAMELEIIEEKDEFEYPEAWEHRPGV
jgi:hypothetical protein